MKGRWVAPDIRDQIMDYIDQWAQKCELKAFWFVNRIGMGRSKYYEWKDHYGKAHEHNGLIPRDFWLEEWEKAAILDFYDQNSLEGYRRLTFMLLDQDRVAVSPSSTYRVLKEAGRIGERNVKPSRKGQGFEQPLKAHEHWHIDISYLNICGTFYYLCSILDGYSRSIIHWEIRESMREAEVERLVQRALEKVPGVHPRVISDNGPQFVAKDFKEYIRLMGLSHVRTSPYYPQSNGKLERWHKTLKGECIRPGTPLSIEDARRIVAQYVEHYNNVRLHSAINYVTPADKLAGREEAILAERDWKLKMAREQRKIKRQNAA